MSRAGKIALKYGISALFCGGCAWLYVAQQDFAALTLVNRYRVLCDAFTIPGMLLILSGLLVWVSNEGAFDGIGYALSTALKALIPGGRRNQEKYYDYAQRKKNKQVKGYGFLFISGGICMAVALVFFALFYSVYG